MIDGLSVRRIGPRDAPAILFSAGLGGSGAYWTPQIDAFAADHAVVLYDHRGTGDSVRPDLPAGYAVQDLADDMAAVLDGLDLPAAHVVGHAAGAVAGLDLARRAPGRMASLTMVNGWASPDPYFLRCLEIRRDILTAQGVAAYLKAQPLFLYPPAWISARLARLDAEHAAIAATFQSPATLFARMRALEAYDAGDALAQVATRALIVAAADDMLVPCAASRVLAGAMPNAWLTTLARGGHAVNVTEPDAFNKILRSFLHDQEHAAKA